VLSDQRLALAAGPPVVLLLERGHRHHRAVAAFTAQPAEEHAQQHLGIEPVGLRPLLVARDGDRSRVDDVRFDAARPQPACQPETVPACLIGERDPGDRLAGGDRLVTPAMHELQERLRIGVELLLRLALDAGHEAGDEPTGPAHLDDHDKCCMLLKGGEGSAQVICTDVPGHGASPSVLPQRR
jgi:hypothetical protein